jgi:hypothetical protein
LLSHSGAPLANPESVALDRGLWVAPIASLDAVKPSLTVDFGQA